MCVPRVFGVLYLYQAVSLALKSTPIIVFGVSKMGVISGIKLPGIVGELLKGMKMLMRVMCLFGPVLMINDSISVALPYASKSE